MVLVVTVTVTGSFVTVTRAGDALAVVACGAVTNVTMSAGGSTISEWVFLLRGSSPVEGSRFLFGVDRKLGFQCLGLHYLRVPRHLGCTL